MKSSRLSKLYCFGVFSLLSIYFILVFVHSFPCHLARLNWGTCQTVNRALKVAGLEQYWTMFSPMVPKQNREIGARVYCKNKHPAYWAFLESKEQSAIEKILNSRLFLYKRELTSFPQKTKSLERFANFALRAQTFCSREEIERIEVILQSEQNTPFSESGPLRTQLIHPVLYVLQ